QRARTRLRIVRSGSLEASGAARPIDVDGGTPGLQSVQSRELRLAGTWRRRAFDLRPDLLGQGATTAPADGSIRPLMSLRAAQFRVGARLRLGHAGLALSHLLNGLLSEE